jgi:hypothetical protein
VVVLDEIGEGGGVISDGRDVDRDCRRGCEQ